MSATERVPPTTSGLLLYLNGKRICLQPEEVSPELTLLEFIRERGITGVKLGCGEGGCGACTVSIARWNATTQRPEHEAVNACLFPICAADGAAVFTTDGIGTKANPHPAQQRVASCHGSQCGYCTPGIVMALFARLQTPEVLSENDIDAALDGNLCRCTGYRPILDAARSFANDTSAPGRLSNDSFPVELREYSNGRSPKLGHRLVSPKAGPVHSVWHQPQTLLELCRLKLENGAAKLVAGNTEVGIDSKFRQREFPVLVYTKTVPELRQISVHDPTDSADEGGFMDVGAAASITEITIALQEQIASRRSQYQVRGFRALLEMLKWFASTQIRNAATLAGNVVTASPISDTCHILVAMGASVELASLPPGVNARATNIQRRRVALADFFLGYRKVDIQATEVLVAIRLPMPTSPNVYYGSFKQGQRREDDIAICGAGFRLEIEIAAPTPSTSGDKETSTPTREPSEEFGSEVRVRDCVFMYGGMAPTVKRAVAIEQFCRGRTLAELTSPASRRKFGELAREKDFNLPPGVPGGRPEYRMTLAASFLFKFLVRVRHEQRDDVGTIVSSTDARMRSLAQAEKEASASHHLVHEDGSTHLQEYNTVTVGGLVTTAASRTQSTDPAGLGHAHLVSASPMSSPSGGTSATVPACTSTHTPVPDDPTAPRGTVGKPVAHRSALLQCTGEALYTEDIALRRHQNTLHAAFVYTDRVCMKIARVDTTAALAMEGVVTWVDESDIPPGGSNATGEIVQDETTFMPHNRLIECTGRIVGIVVAHTRRQALAAAAAVKVDYSEPSATETKTTPIFSIDAAIKVKSFIGDPLIIRDGNVDAVFKRGHRITPNRGTSATNSHANANANSNAKANTHGSSQDTDETISDPDVIVVEGEIRIGGQEHFYLETQATWAIPGESGAHEMHIVASTQSPKGTQEAVHRLLGIPFHKITVQVKRLGGGFGGKETRTAPVTAALALAAQKVDRPVVMMLDRNEDMKISGGRHPFFGRYKAAARLSDCKLLALKTELYSNAGWSLDLSRGVMERAVWHVDNGYKWGALDVVGTICKTNLPSNTAFRGFGGPQGMMVCETAVEHLAGAMKVSPEKLRQVNLYRPGDTTHYGMPVCRTQLPRLWDQVKQLANWPARQVSVEDFNRKHRWRKRGVALLPTKFGIAFGANFLNQAGALVQVYVDGTVLVTHGGVEMGQGLHTKMTQIAARVFEIGLSRVHVAETATDKVPNSSPSAASASSDMYGMAVLQACEVILQRITNFHESLENAVHGTPDARLKVQLDDLKAKRIPGEANDGYFNALVHAAYFHRVSLSATGYHATPTAQYVWSDTQPTQQDSAASVLSPFNYFSEGSACCEVEVDVLTGDMRIVHASLVMDVGNSLNAAVDVGQIEGAFMQGLGLFAMEELIWGDEEHPWVRPGQLFTAGPGLYKIPAFGDVPHRFQVRLLDKSPNSRTIHSSKAVGEPPFFLAASAFMAVRRAIAAARGSAAGVATMSTEGTAAAAEQSVDTEEAWFPLDSPASVERIRMACTDEITRGLGIPENFRARGSV